MMINKEWILYFCYDNRNKEFTERHKKKIDPPKKKLKSEMHNHEFSRTEPIQIVNFLQNFKPACNSSNVHEGQAVWLFSGFINISDRDWNQRTVIRITAVQEKDYENLDK